MLEVGLALVVGGESGEDPVRSTISTAPEGADLSAWVANVGR